MDGIVVTGEGVLDESALTGEAEPKSKAVDSLVCSGTIVQNGYLEVRATATAESSTIQMLNTAVMDVQADKVY